jgi:hypothetical protein
MNYSKHGGVSFAKIVTKRALMSFVTIDLPSAASLILQGAVGVSPPLLTADWYAAFEKSILAAVIETCDGSYSYTVWARKYEGDYTRLRTCGAFRSANDALTAMEQHLAHLLVRSAFRMAS